MNALLSRRDNKSLDKINNRGIGHGVDFSYLRVGQSSFTVCRAGAKRTMPCLRTGHNSIPAQRPNSATSKTQRLSGYPGTEPSTSTESLWEDTCRNCNTAISDKGGSGKGLRDYFVEFQPCGEGGVEEQNSKNQGVVSLQVPSTPNGDATALNYDSKTIQ
eukprot:scaffold1087_cov136-Cylindrotheca_fusiformis.AAC.10